MPNKRKEGKHQHTFWCSDDEWLNLRATADEIGFDNVSEMILAVARGEVNVAVLPAAGTECR